jgi:hypothetical protein
MSREIRSGGYAEIVATVPDGCRVCAALAKEWFESRDRDVLLEINNHPHSAPKLNRVKRWKATGVPHDAPC